MCVSTRTAIDPRKLVRSNGRGHQTLTFMEKIYFEATSKYLLIPIDLGISKYALRSGQRSFLLC